MTTTTRLLGALALLTSTLALAQAPQKIAYQGLLLKSDGTPETGTVQIKFSIFNQATNGTELWTETQTAVALTQGFYATTLGEGTAFPNALFDGTERFLEIAVGNPLVPMTPRMRVVSVPYAIAAGSATNVNGGTVNASSISIGGNPVIDSSGNLVGNATYQGANGVSVTGRTIGLVPGCQAGETLKWSGAPTNAWQCAAGAPAASDGGVVAYTADPDGGLQLTGTNFTQFSLLRSCTANQLLKWSGSAWVCADDNTGTSYNIASGQGLALSGAQNNLFGLQNCTSGQILKSGGGNWACQGDNDTTYTATVNKGLLLTGTGFGIDACPAGQVMKSTGTGNWSCAADDNAAYDVIVNGGLRRTGNNFGIGSCASGEIMKSQGSGLWSCQADNNAGGTVTQIITAGGITGGPITSTGTLALAGTVPNWTAAGAASCAPGQALRVIAGDGTPTCVSITGGGTVLQVSAGTGIVTSPDAGITATGTISVGPFVQNWTNGQPSCPAGQALSAIAVDGLPSCVVVSLDGGGGGGSVTSVGSGAGLTGGPITGSGTLSIATGGVTNAMLQNNGVTVSPGTGLSGGGAVALGGTTTLSLATPVSAGNGGTGVTGPTAAGQFLRSSAPGAWSVATLSASDIPTLTQYVDLTTNQTIGGVKTFSSIIQGSISGNAATATNGVVTTGTYGDPPWITSLAGSKITGAISGNAAGFTGNLNGDVTGAQGSTVVGRIRGTTVSTTVTPANGTALTYNGTSLQYEPLQPNGDVTGPLQSNTVARIRGVPVSTTGPTNGAMIAFNAGTSQYEPTLLGGDLTNVPGNARVTGIRGINVAVGSPLSNQVLAYNGITGNWTPTSITATSPVSIVGNDVRLITCTPGQVLKANTSGTLVCSPEDPALVGVQSNQGLQVSAGQVGLISCPSGLVLKAGATLGTWACGTDTDTTYSATFNGGLTQTGTSFGLSSACTAGQVMKSSGSGVWSCGTDNGTVTSISIGAGLSSTQSPLTTSGTLSIATGGVTGGMILDDTVTGADVAANTLTAEHVALPIGSGSGSVTVAVGSNYVYTTGYYTPQVAGTCYVTAYAETPEASATGYFYVTGAAEAGGVDNVFGPSVYAYTSTTTYYAASSTYTYSVSAGVQYRFGCRIYVSTGSSFIGNSLACYTTYICT